jgi:hypothetical protein
VGGEGGREVALVWSVHPLRAQELMALPEQAFGIELAQALWFLVCPYLMIMALQLRLALRILGEDVGDKALITMMYRFRIKVQLIGFTFISLTAAFAFFHLMIHGYFR